MKIWEKNIPTNQKIEAFTVGADTYYDMFLAPYDIIGSLAHIKMLRKIQLLEEEEYELLVKELKNIYALIQEEKFEITGNAEDVHSMVEWLLTEKLGSIGKKIHAGRSRNDQVLVDLQLMFRDEIKTIVESIEVLFKQLMSLADQHRDVLMPGYTHLQAAMPSSFGLWFSAYAENLIDDLSVWKSAFTTIDQNPLGSGAGYGTSLPLDRTYTTELLGFKTLAYNVVHAQMGRSRSELFLSYALSATANTLGKLAMDVCLYNSQNFGFIKLDDAFTTGSSIMPHKKNPDVFELVRAKCNRIGQLPGLISGAFGYLPSGYHRDFQLLKESVFPAIAEIKSCLDIVTLALQNITVQVDLMNDARYRLTFSVEVVNHLVNQGVPFREAYQQVAKDIQQGSFTPPLKLDHTHEGSIGNLCLPEIKQKMSEAIQLFDFSYLEKIKKLLG
ncbi:MAG: argininosuccinate lyase [Saprospiraceae bacterium]|nr:argininosuccinate lyase [Saprospiraceae bacterium]